MAKTVKMTMAKASKDDIHSTLRFMMALEELGRSEFDLSYWERQDDKEFYRLLKSLTDTNDKPDLENLLYVFEREYSHKWRRVVIGCDILIDNFCDPKLDHLAPSPELLALADNEEDETAG